MYHISKSQSQAPVISNQMPPFKNLYYLLIVFVKLLFSTCINIIRKTSFDPESPPSLKILNKQLHFMIDSHKVATVIIIKCRQYNVYD